MGSVTSGQMLIPSSGRLLMLGLRLPGWPPGWVDAPRPRDSLPTQLRDSGKHIGLFFPEIDRSWTSKAMACHGSCSLGMQFLNQSINSSVGLSVAFSCFGSMKPSVSYEFDFFFFCLFV